MVVYISGTGTAGSYFDTNGRQFPAVPYGGQDFNDGNCYTSSGNIENYQDANQVAYLSVLHKHGKI